MDLISQKQYNQANEILIKLGNFRDSKKQLSASRCILAEDLLRENKYLKACKILSSDDSSECAEHLAKLLDEEPALAFYAAKIGEEVTFGRAQMSDIEEDSWEKLSWVKLGEIGNKVLVACTVVIDALPQVEVEDYLMGYLYEDLFANYFAKDAMEPFLYQEDNQMTTIGCSRENIYGALPMYWIDYTNYMSSSEYAKYRNETEKSNIRESTAKLEKHLRSDEYSEAKEVYLELYGGDKENEYNQMLYDRALSHMYSDPKRAKAMLEYLDDDFEGVASKLAEVNRIIEANGIVNEKQE